MSPIFFDLECHVVLRSCTVRVDDIVPMKYYEVHVPIRLKACYNNSKGRISKKAM